MTTNPATMREARLMQRAIESGEAPPAIDLSPNFVPSPVITPAMLAGMTVAFAASTEEYVAPSTEDSRCGATHRKGAVCSRVMDHDGQHIDAARNQTWRVGS